jgi:predicted DNA-binding WGR domain protein
VADLVEVDEEGLCMDNYHWNDDVQYRFECTTGGSNKFYEITLEEGASEWILTCVYGSMRPGRKPIQQGFSFRSRREAEEKMNQNIQKRLSHGYKEV